MVRIKQNILLPNDINILTNKHFTDTVSHWVIYTIPFTNLYSYINFTGYYQPITCLRKLQNI